MFHTVDDIADVSPRMRVRVCRCPVKMMMPLMLHLVQAWEAGWAYSASLCCVARGGKFTCQRVFLQCTNFIAFVVWHQCACESLTVRGSYSILLVKSCYWLINLFIIKGWKLKNIHSALKRVNAHERTAVIRVCWIIAVPAEGNGDLQTLICVLAARFRRCPTLSNPVLWQSWIAAYPGSTIKTLFSGSWYAYEKTEFLPVISDCITTLVSVSSTTLFQTPIIPRERLLRSDVFLHLSDQRADACLSSGLNSASIARHYGLVIRHLDPDNWTVGLQCMCTCSPGESDRYGIICLRTPVANNCGCKKSTRDCAVLFYNGGVNLIWYDMI